MHRWDAAQVEERLSEAGRTLLALRVQGVWPAGIRSNMPDFVRQACEAYGYTPADVPPASPNSREVSRMDQALSWIRLIPEDRVTLRRIVGARCLTRPNQHRPDELPRPVLSWRKIAAQVGASDVSVKEWHRQAIGMIVDALNRPGFCARSGGAVGLSPDQVDLVIRRAMARGGRPAGVRRRELA